MADSYVKCDKCSASKQVDFTACLRSGWPKCCGKTMRLINTQADIDAAVSKAMSPIKGFFRA